MVGGYRLTNEWQFEPTKMWCLLTKVVHTYVWWLTFQIDAIPKSTKGCECQNSFTFVMCFCWCRLSKIIARILGVLMIQHLILWTLDIQGLPAGPPNHSPYFKYPQWQNRHPSCQRCTASRRWAWTCSSCFEPLPPVGKENKSAWLRDY